MLRRLVFPSLLLASTSTINAQENLSDTSPVIEVYGYEEKTAYDFPAGTAHPDRRVILLVGNDGKIQKIGFATGAQIVIKQESQSGEITEQRWVRGLFGVDRKAVKVANQKLVTDYLDDELIEYKKENEKSSSKPKGAGEFISGVKSKETSLADLKRQVLTNTYVRDAENLSTYQNYPEGTTKAYSTAAELSSIKRIKFISMAEIKDRIAFSASNQEFIRRLNLKIDLNDARTTKTPEASTNKKSDEVEELKEQNRRLLEQMQQLQKAIEELKKEKGVASLYSNDRSRMVGVDSTDSKDLFASVTSP